MFHGDHYVNLSCSLSLFRSLSHHMTFWVISFLLSIFFFCVSLRSCCVLKDGEEDEIVDVFLLVIYSGTASSFNLHRTWGYYLSIGEGKDWKLWAK